MGHPNQLAREETDRWLNSGNQLDRICQGIKTFLEVISAFLHRLKNDADLFDLGISQRKH
jgi:hypothetical protein